MPFLEISHIYKAFGGLQAIRDFSLEITGVSIVGIIGPNGAGKTTLFNVIAGFYKPDSGKVVFRGKEITHSRPDQICELGIVRTFQIPRPFKDLSVYENVMVGALLREKRIKNAHNIVLEVLEYVGLTAQLGKRARDLTIPERKRLEFARCLATRPKMLMLDEVFAGLNPSETEELMKMIRKIHAQGISILIIEHNMQAIMNLSDHIVVLNHGEKIAEGRPETVLTNRQVIEAYLGEEYA